MYLNKHKEFNGFNNGDILCFIKKKDELILKRYISEYKIKQDPRFINLNTLMGQHSHLLISEQQLKDAIGKN